MPKEKEREQLMDALEKIKLPSIYSIESSWGLQALDPVRYPSFIVYERELKASIKGAILGDPAEIFRVSDATQGKIKIRDQRIEKEMTDLAKELGYDLEIKYRKKE